MKHPLTTEESERSRRLRIFIDHLGMKDKDFAARVGIKPQYLSNLLNRRKMITYEMIEKITRHYTGLSRDWLLSGAGDMMMPDPLNPPIDSHMVQESNPHYPHTPPRILIAPISADAAYNAEWPSEWTRPPRELDTADCVRIGSGAAEIRLYRVQTHSLLPLVAAGDWIACRAANLKEGLKPGELYVVITRTGVLMKKCALFRPNERVYLATGVPDGMPFIEVPVQDILQVWQAVVRVSGG